MHMLLGLCELIFNFFFQRNLGFKFHGCGSKRPIGWQETELAAFW